MPPKAVEDLSRDLYFECDFLVCGFDERENPHISTITRPGVPKRQDAYGYRAIGTGADSVHLSLTMNRYNFLCELSEAVYFACEAKFVSESMRGVGEATFVVVQREEFKPLMLRKDDVAKIREAWKQRTVTPPQSAVEFIHGIIDTRSQAQPRDRFQPTGLRATPPSGSRRRAKPRVRTRSSRGR